MPGIKLNRISKEEEKVLNAYARKKARELGMKGFKQTDLDGILYIGGYCLRNSEDKEMGRKFMQLAAEKGNAEAQARYGMLFYFGKYVEKDLTQSIYWFKLAADQKDSTGMNCLGHCLLHGIGIDQDVQRGFELTREAAKSENIGAYEGLGYCYFNGAGTEKDPDLARLWWEKAAADGDEDAKENLIRHYGLKKEDLSLEPYDMLKNAFNSTVFDYFSNLLTEDAVYSSIWLEEPIQGGSEIAKYLYDKSEEICKTKTVKSARLVRMIKCKNPSRIDEDIRLGHYAVELDNLENTSLVLLSGEDPYVSRMAVFNADHFDYEVIPDPDLMTKEEIHEFGLQIVCSYLEKDGYSIEHVEPRMKKFPQIIANKDEIQYMIVVETEVAPFKGRLIEELKMQMADISKEHGAVGCFASVSIGSANEEHFAKSIARRSDQYHVLYKGLELMEGKSNLN